MTESKRIVPPLLRVILNADEEITKKFVLWGNSLSPLHALRMHFQALEITCHGIPWLVFWVAVTWLFNKPSLVPLQVNMLLALILDIVAIALLKAYFRRRRPMGNKDDAFAQIGPDNFSFPSGHVSRAAMVVFIFIFLYPVSIIFYPPMFAWVTVLAISRVLMERHYLLDVAGGLFLGIFEGILMSILWLSDENARWLFNCISDEKLEGGEFHV
ncbi:phospholipid phosphatase 6-like [Sitophilus oryzae]|uniref:Phospholipid phosphatase 6-like n=1 Tax=Sitophilus oryzae TaxID=7048 RepID=A0A6J2YPW2_SITOR|nr:phospholipid phosphatase 6-like [Sitophilus oryzae]